VEPSFSNHWQRYKRALQQRNAALKEYKITRQDHYQIWDSELIDSGEQIDQIRKRLLEEWKPLFFALLDKFLNLGKVIIQYKRGWSDSRTLSEALDAHRERDQVLGFTTQGIHRADLDFIVEDAPAKQHLSRGQSKLFVAALLISRAQFFSQKTDRKCVFLVDDLPSELDDEAGYLFIDGLKNVGGQIFITGIESERLTKHLQDASFKLFHVEHGKVQEILLSNELSQCSAALQD
jgi:DNA replication and repair protein RecF